jgi:hypothetical protein
MTDHWNCYVNQQAQVPKRVITEPMHVRVRPASKAKRTSVGRTLLSAALDSENVSVNI